MKTFPSLAFIALAMVTTTLAQPIDVAVSIDDSREVHPISPLIYGVNNSSNASANLASRRQGGDRYTTYNWENNASNSGHWTDDPQYENLNHTSDANVTGYVPSNVPAKAITDFHDASTPTGIYSLVTLQAGHVARDLNGPVSVAEAVPNPARWREVKFDKAAPLTLAPDVNDAYVYMDELIAYLIDKYGPASAAMGVKGYGISNEPGLWNRVHPRSHPVKEGYVDIFATTIGLASTIKRMDPAAEVYGGVTYGFSEMKDFDGAGDRGLFPQFKWYIDALLSKTMEASENAGLRLMDVLDVHWYSEAEGDQQYASVAWSASTPDIVRARLQAPRSLWDMTFVENSWITGAPGRFSHTSELFGTAAIALIPRLQESIATYNEGTKIAFGEFGYGGYDHVSGGIAVADALGIFGRTGVYYANHWDDITGYVESAYKLYRNYDGERSTFGDVSAYASSSDIANSSVYAATSVDGNEMHVILINKSMTESMRSAVSIASPKQWANGKAFGFDASSTSIRALGDVTVGENGFVQELAPMSVVHIVLPRRSVSGINDGSTEAISANIAPNPCSATVSIALDLRRTGHVSIALYDALGRNAGTLLDGECTAGRSLVTFDATAFSPGRYVARVMSSDRSLTLPVTIVR